jgi:starch phosphorylase
MPATITTAPATEATRLEQAIRQHVVYTLGTQLGTLAPRQRFQAVALAVRDRLIDQLLATERRYHDADVKRLYYLSLEFLIGRSLDNNLVNLGLRAVCEDVCRNLGLPLEEVADNEVDAALGNGGLGRLAACFLDSLATLGLPGYGYGINYDYGLFKQEIRGGEQVERPDSWKTYASPWMIERPQHAVLIPVYGRVENSLDRFGNYNPMWLDWRVVIGVPSDIPIVGFGGKTVHFLRLYSARASQEVDMRIFNEGDYVHAVQQKVLSETISKVLYPSESPAAGRELRLIQEYFLSACAIRDIVRRYRQKHNTFDAFPDKVAMQLNDTHPTLAIPELMRTLVDEYNYNWEKAWDITTRTFAYTNHTLLPEALEKWPVSLLETVLPRHMQIIFEINRRFLDTVRTRTHDEGRISRLSVIEEGGEKRVRMANLAIIGSHSVNGVAAVHSHLVQTELVPDFAWMTPEKFNNKTNGVTPRRWLLSANPALAGLLHDTIGDAWITNLDRLRDLEPYADDPSFQEQFLQVKRQNKTRLARYLLDLMGVPVDVNSLFDIQVKRIHEYKRQLLNLLNVLHEYLCLVEDGIKPAVPRTHLFAGKAAPGYRLAKNIIRLINDASAVINADRRTEGLLRLLFVPDYRVTLAEMMIPAADLSEQVSTAGTEASGTGNMKFAMNGALTIGTLDGANIEIRQEVGAENFFLFGLTVDQVRQLQRAGSYRPAEIAQRNRYIGRILTALDQGRFCPDQPDRHRWVAQRLLTPMEQYFHIADLESYLTAQQEVSGLYQQRQAWARKAILNVARVGKFSSDRTIMDYARDIWGLKPVG